MIFEPLGRAGTSLFNLAPWFFLAHGFATPLPPAVKAAYMAPWRDRRRRRPAAIAPHELIHARAFLQEVEASLSRLADRPVLLVWGMRDFAFQEEQRMRFERHFPNHRTVLYPDASHFVQEDAGEAIAAEIRRWLAEARAASR